MNFVLRNFFYGVGLVTLWLMAHLSPEKAEFRDLVVIMHAPAFWSISGCVAAMLAGMDFVLSGKAVVTARPAGPGKSSGGAQGTF